MNEMPVFRLIIIILVSCVSTVILPGQSFVNPSFEGEPQEAFVPVGWTPCAVNTTPDIFPGVWGVDMDAADGSTYMGLITRSDGSYESVGQRLPVVVEGGECYTFSFFLAKSDTYAGFNEAIRCRIWLGSSSCVREQLIFESDKLEDTDWRKEDIRFKAEKNHQFLIIEAAYPTKSRTARGNMLIDGLSSIIRCDRA